MKSIIFMFTLFSNVFGQSQPNLRGSMVSKFFNIDDEFFHLKEFNSFRENTINVLTHGSKVEQKFHNKVK